MTGLSISAAYTVKKFHFVLLGSILNNADFPSILFDNTFVKVGFYWPICVVNALKARK